MSRVGKLPIPVPSGVNVEVSDKTVNVSGSRGNLSMSLLPGISARVDGNNVIVERKKDEAIYRARHGLVRTLLSNMIIGVSEGFSKKLEIHGVGYRVNLVGTGLKFNLGFSHDVTYKIPEGVIAAVEQNIVTVSGIDKQKVGQVAAEIRALRKPEPYKGKGIRYENERIIRKSGKSGKEKA